METETLEHRRILEQNVGKALVEVDDLDDLSNSVLDLILVNINSTYAK
jgi:hypothetical protein